MTQADQTEDLTFELGMAGDLEQFLGEHLPGQDHRAAAQLAVAWMLSGAEAEPAAVEQLILGAAASQQVSVFCD